MIDAVVVVAGDDLRPDARCAPRRSRAAAPSRRGCCARGCARCRRCRARSAASACDVHLPGAAEQVEVVDVEAAQRRLQRGEDVGDAQPERLRLVAVDVEEQRRVGRGEGREHARSAAGPGWPPRPAPRITRAELAPASCPSQCLKLVFEAAAGAEADDRRQVEGEDVGGADLLRRRRTPGRSAACAEFAGRGAVGEGLQPRHQEGGVRLLRRRRAARSR